MICLSFIGFYLADLLLGALMKNFIATYQKNEVGFLPPADLLKPPHRRMIFCVTVLLPAPS